MKRRVPIAEPGAQRQVVELTEAERAQHAGLPPWQGFAFQFWGRMAAARGLDATTVICANGKITALPIGHGKHWCYPSALKMQKRPVITENA